MQNIMMKAEPLQTKINICQSHAQNFKYENVLDDLYQYTHQPKSTEISGPST